MSNAAWCCSADDGNAWFGGTIDLDYHQNKKKHLHSVDTYFNVKNWKRGLAWIANHGKTWPAMVSLALRNELRQPVEGDPARAHYGWADWYTNMIEAADGINAANPAPL